VIGRLLVAAVVAFMTLPTVVVVVASFNPTAILSFPPEGLSLRWYENALTYPQFRRAAINSLIVTATSALVALPVGTAAALAVVRHPWPGRLRAAGRGAPGAGRGAPGAGRGALEAVLMSPLVIPGVAAGLGLLIVAAPLGLLANPIVLIAAHVVLVLPFVIRSVAVSVANLDPMLERAAASLGARPWRVFLRVTLPLLRPGLFAALLFAVIVSANEFVVSLFVSTRVTEILPVAMFTYVVNYTDPTMAALSTLFIAATFVTVFLADRFLGLSRVFQIGDHR
jgi:putative spermidine/putrescine transport system permease protein